MTAEMVIRAFETRAREIYQRIEETEYKNFSRVLEAFKKHRVASHHFAGSTGYGYNDMGRNTLERLYADVFGGEEALVRSALISGTHAIAQCLMAVLEPGDMMVSAMGRPYDTLNRIIHGDKGLIRKGIKYIEVPLGYDGGMDWQGLQSIMKEKPRMVFIQRSRGYSRQRRALRINDIEKAVQIIRGASNDCIIMVDNCYGEFVEEMEPGHVGVDICAGSLIKNPGGGLAPGGGYVVGRRELIEVVADHLVAPGLGREIGPSLYDLRIIYQGLFIAPHIVAEALKGAVLAAGILEEMGYPVFPRWDESRGDIVQGIGFTSRNELERFVQHVQACSPVESHVCPEFSPLPGYDEEIIMAAGTFVQGSSIELSCDGPLREPLTAYLQGGLCYAHVRHMIGEFRKNAIE